MIAGPSKETQQRHSIVHIQRILDIAPYFIDLNKKDIFVLTAESSQSALQEILLNEALWQSDEPQSAIRLAIEKHRLEIPFYKSQKEKLEESLEACQKKNSQGEASAIIRSIEKDIQELAPKVSPIGDYEWAVLCKLTMQSGKVLHDSVSTQYALNKLIAELRALCKIFNSDMYKTNSHVLQFKPKYVQTLFTQFITHLCQNGEQDSAEVIHQYISFAQWVLSKRERNDVDETKIAMTLAPGLFQGLDIFGQMIPRTGSELENMQADSCEYRFFKQIMIDVIECPYFREPFNIARYFNISQHASAEPLPRASSSTKVPERSRSGSQSSSVISKLRNLSFTDRRPGTNDEIRRPREGSIPSSQAAEPESSPPLILPGFSLLHAVTNNASSSSSSVSEPDEERKSKSKSKDRKFG